MTKKLVDNFLSLFTIRLDKCLQKNCLFQDVDVHIVLYWIGKWAIRIEALIFVSVNLP